MRDRIRVLKGAQVYWFYHFLLKELRINRHAHPDIQIQLALSADEEVIEKCLQQTEEKIRQEEKRND